MERGKLTLYVAGAKAAGTPWVEELRGAVLARLGPEHPLEVVDLQADPARARAGEVRVVPTLVLETSQGRTRAFGDLSDPGQALRSLGLEA